MILELVLVTIEAEHNKQGRSTESIRAVVVKGTG
jgi:hypothetical protein